MSIGSQTLVMLVEHRTQQVIMAETNKHTRTRCVPRNVNNAEQSYISKRLNDKDADGV